MATKVWKRLRRVEKAGLIALCAVMLLTLGIGGSTVFGSCDKSVQAGSITIDGEKIPVDPVAFNQFLKRHHALLRVSSMATRQTPRIETSQLEQQFLLWQLAERAGIEVSDDTLRQIIQEHPMFSSEATRRFDARRYRQLMEMAKSSENEFEQALRELLQIRGYMDLFENVLGPTREEVYAAYKARNKKYRVEYTWMPLDPFREKTDPAAFTEEELAAYYETIKNEFKVETRRQVESAYVVLVDVPDEEVAALHEKFPDCQVSYADGYMYFRRRTDDFTFRAFEEIRARREGKGQEKPDGGKEETGKAGTDESGRTGEEGPARPPAESTPPAVPPGGDDDRRQVAEDVPADDPPAPAPAPDTVAPEGEVPPGGVEPGEAATPEKPAEPGKAAEPTEQDRYDELKDQERYETYWADIIRKELLFQRLAQRLLDEAKETKAPLEELAKKYGLRYLKTELLAPIAMQSVPSIGCEDLRLETNKYDKRFEGNLIPRVLPTTNTSTEPLRRGWQVVRIVQVDAEHVSPLADVEAKVRTRYLEKRIHAAAEAEMKTVIDAASAAGAEFAAVVAEKGLPLRPLPAFNASSPRPFVDAEALKGTDPEAKARAREAALDGFVMTRGLSDIRGGDFTPGGEVRLSHPLIDDGDGNGVVLIHVLGKEDPGPEEMSRRDGRDIRRQQIQIENARLGESAFSLESLTERLEFVRPAGAR